MGWDSSDRRSRLPKDWPAIRRRAFSVFGDTCMEQGCNLEATDVDHVRPGDDHGLGNLQVLCHRHHEVKSRREGREAQLREQKRLKALAKRPPERHPNSIPPRRARPLQNRGW